MKIKPLVAAVVAFATFQAFASSSDREFAWHAGGHVNTHWSMLDALEQALSMAVNGEDLHSHQIHLRRRTGQTFRDQANLTHGRSLCSEFKGSGDWAALECRPFAIPKNMDPSNGCQSQRCTEIEFAPFVVNDAAIWAAIEAAAKEPCKHIPDYRELQKRHRTTEPRGGITMHTSNVSHYWLYCDTRRPITGSLSPTPKERVFVLRWHRDAR